MVKKVILTSNCCNIIAFSGKIKRSLIDTPWFSVVLLQCNKRNQGHSTFFYQSQDEYRTKELEYLQFPVRFDPHLWLVRNVWTPILWLWTRLVIGRTTLSGPGWVCYTVLLTTGVSESNILLKLQVGIATLLWLQLCLLRRKMCVKPFQPADLLKELHESRTNQCKSEFKQQFEINVVHNLILISDESLEFFFQFNETLLSGFCRFLIESKAWGCTCHVCTACIVYVHCTCSTQRRVITKTKCCSRFNFRRNEEVDKNMVIRRLQRKLAKLHLELANYKVHFIALKLDVK